ncbi:MAG TPA: DUF6402 family protein [Flavobacterium sp.]|jgi:hypothetical protein
MFTKEQLAKWRNEGFVFDDFYDQAAIEEVAPQVGNSAKNILGYMWCNAKGRTFPNGFLTYGEESLSAIFMFTEKVKNRTCIIDVININTNKAIFRKRFKISAVRLQAKFNIEDFFQDCNEPITNFRIRVVVDTEQYVRTSSEPLVANHEHLKICFVILIPKIMKKFKWTTSVELQEEWFTHQANNYPWESKPRLSFFSFKDWALSFNRIQELYKNNKDVWKSANSIASLKNEIRKMVKDGYAVMPTRLNKLASFGPPFGDGTLVEHSIFPEELDHKRTKIRVPLFDKYYFSSFEHREGKLSPELDDFYGAIANCSIRFTACGILEYVDDQTIMVTITELGVYIRDGFDFVGSQSLGYWSYKEGAVTTNMLSNGSYVGISNGNYRSYRSVTGMGQDFYTYSAILKSTPNFKFAL